MNYKEAVEKLMYCMSTVDSGVIAALMLAQGDDWEEVTTPCVGCRVTLYEGDDEIDGEVHQLSYDIATQKTSYGIDVGDEDDMWTDDTSLFDVVFDSILPNCDVMFSPQNVFGDFLTPNWFEHGGIEILSQIGFRVYKSNTFGYFFGVDNADLEHAGLEEFFGLLYDSLDLEWDNDCERGKCHYCGRSIEEIELSDTDHTGLLICGYCGKSYCYDCLTHGVNEKAFNQMTWYGDTLLCPKCAKLKGYCE